LSGAEVTLDSTITSGTWRVFGVGTLTDNSIGSAVVDSSGLVSKEWTQTEIDESLAYSKKASDNAEQVNLKIT